MVSFAPLPFSFDTKRPGPPAIIVVGTTWCSFCKQLKPELARIQKFLSARVYWVDGDTDPRARAWASGYPTILYHATAGGLYKHNGPRTLQGIQRFIDAVEAV